MKLTLTKEQKQHLNKNGPLSARDLQRVFENSVKDQEKLRKEAAKIRKQSK
jgi:hypothetical protein